MLRKNGFWLCRLFFFMSATAMFGANAWSLPEKPQLLNDMEQRSGAKLNLSYHAATGKVRFIRPEGNRGIPVAGLTAEGAIAAGPEAAARGFMTRYGTLFGLKDQARELTVRQQKTIDDGRHILKFKQTYQGLPVIAGELVVQINAGNDIMSVNGEISPDPGIDVTPAVTAADARAKALSATAKYHKADQAKLEASEPVLSIYNPVLLGPGLNGNTLVWQVEVSSTDGSPIREFFLIDAQKGYIALHFNQVHRALYRKIYDNRNALSSSLALYPVARVEGGAASTITDVNDAYDFLGNTYAYYLTNHNRNGIDNKGMQMISTVRYCEPGESCPYQNAFWNGKQMVFGQGFASALDVVSHELTHGVTEKESGLFYYMQSGAINESLSDVFGEFIELSTPGQNTTTDRWLMGEQLSISAIRNMKDPTTFGDPDKMGSTNYYCGTGDGGGVHTNSGVNNKAAYLMADGDFFNGITVTGIGIPKTSKIYYEAQTNILTSGSDYADLYDALILACQNLVGTSGIISSDCDQVKNALDAVQMNQQPASCAAPEAPLCEPELSAPPLTIFYDGLEKGTAKWLKSTLHAPNVWTVATTGYAANGTHMLYGYDYWNISDSAVSMASSVHIPSTGAYFLHFKHAFDFERGVDDYYDGGVVEYSADAGRTWTDISTLSSNNAINGYGAGTIFTDSDNPLAGKSGFLGMSNGYHSTRYDLSSLAGRDVRFRFRIGTDVSGDNIGWVIDDVRIYTCSGSGLTPTLSIRPTATNPDPDYTKTTTVTLLPALSGGLLPTDAKGLQMQFSNNGKTWSAWSAYASAKSWTLLPGDGLKTVRVRFQDLGSEPSPAAEAQITYDATKPAGTLSVTKIAGTPPGIKLDWPGYTDALSGIKEYNLFYSPTAMPASCAGTRILGPTQNTTFTSSDSSTTSNLVSGKYYYFRVCATDKAGNVSPGLTAKVMAASEVDPPTGGVSIKPTTTNPDPNYTKTATVLLSLTSSASDLSKMCVSNTPTCTTWTAVPTTAQPWTKSWTLPTTPVKNGSKTVYVRFMDKLENISDPYTAQITLDTIKPTGTISIEGGAASTTKTAVDLTLACTDANMTGLQMRFSTNGTIWTPWESYATSKTGVALAAPTVMGLKRVYVQYMDKAGNISLSSSDTITLTK